MNLNRDGSYIDSPDWIKNKNATINSIKKNDNKYPQYGVTVALNNEEIGKNLERISKIKPFSKHDSNREKQVILLMILSGEGWDYLVVNKLSAL